MKCEDYQLACYDLLDRTLCAKDEREVLAHIEHCCECRSFLEEEEKRMRTWPRLLKLAARNVSMPTDAVERITHALEISKGQGFRFRLKEWERTHFSGRTSFWVSLAASLLILASLGSVYWLTQDHLWMSRVNIADNTMPEVRLVKQRDIQEISVPKTLPGVLSLASGEIVARLKTGVELTLIGPTRLVVQNGWNVSLEQGQLLANVPHCAIGFTVRTRELEIRDLGTVFGVQAKAAASDVFVFKGRVQVNEATYSETGCEMPEVAVGICEAGAGVRMVSGKRTIQFAVDGPEAEKLFQTVQGESALLNPSQALATATYIADLGSGRNISDADRVTNETEKGIAFQNTASVQTTAPVHQWETTNMNKTSAAMVLAAATMATGVFGSASSEPISVNTSLMENRLWETVFTNEVDVAWHWEHPDAVNAELSISGMGGEVLATNVSRSVSNVLWRAFEKATPAVEDVYELRLTFLGANETVLGALTSRLAVVKGAFGMGTVDANPVSASWAKVKDNVVLAYDKGWMATTANATTSQLTIAKINGISQINVLEGTSGYYGWKLKKSDWGYGKFNLTLSFPGEQGEWNETVNYIALGTLIGIR